MTEFEKWLTYIGKRVRVLLCRADMAKEGTDIWREGILLKLDVEGEFDIRDDDGVIWYCWPALDVEEVMQSEAQSRGDPPGPEDG